MPVAQLASGEEAMQSWRVRPVGFVHSPFSQTTQVPRGLGAKHEEEGTLEILPEFAALLLALSL